MYFKIFTALLNLKLLNGNDRDKQEVERFDIIPSLEWIFLPYVIRSF